MTAEPDMLRSCLRAMIDDTAKIVSRYHDPELERTSGYVLHMGRIIEHMRLRSLHSILEERYDLESARIVMVLLDKKFLEQSSIGELAMIPAKVEYNQPPASSPFSGSSSTLFLTFI
jgi:hypothetical protein